MLGMYIHMLEVCVNIRCRWGGKTEQYPLQVDGFLSLCRLIDWSGFVWNARAYKWHNNKWINAPPTICSNKHKHTHTRTNTRTPKYVNEQRVNIADRSSQLISLWDDYYSLHSVCVYFYYFVRACGSIIYEHVRWCIWNSIPICIARTHFRLCYYADHSQDNRRRKP